MSSARSMPAAARDQVRFGVLGCASVAWRRTLPALRAHPRTSVVAVASRDPKKAARYAARFGCATTTYTGLLTRDDVDAIYLPLPVSMRVAWTEAALRAGKHVLTEKPAAPTAEQTNGLLELAGRRRLVFRENFMFLHHSQHAAACALIADGRIGTLRSFHSTFCIPPRPGPDIRYSADLGGGALLDLGVYPLRAAQMFLSGDLAVAGASLRVDVNRGIDLSGQALLVSGEGLLASIGFGFEHSYGSSYTLWGSTARMHLDRAYTPPDDWTPVLRIEAQDHTADLMLPRDQQFERAVGSFAEAVLDDHPASAAEVTASIRTAELVDAIRKQAVRTAVRRDRSGATGPAER